MPDFLSKEERSAHMARIRGRGNRSTEMRLITLMRAWRIVGWRRNYPLPGRPDFVFREKRIVVFVDGCFWHGCPIHFVKPASSRKFWLAKIHCNRLRDKKVDKMLKAAGWRVLRLWEHDLRSRRCEAARVRLAELFSNSSEK